MGIVFAVLFLAAAVFVLVVYGGTPHGGPTTSCGPVHAFGHSVTITMDCRYLSAGEIVAAIVLFLLALLAAIIARPGS